MCELIQHKCDGPLVSSPPLKKVKTKRDECEEVTEQSKPVVTLRSIDDENVPAITDEDIPLAITRKKKHN